MRDAAWCCLRYPPLELAGYFPEPLRGFEVHVLAAVFLHDSYHSVHSLWMAMTALFFVDATAR